MEMGACRITHAASAACAQRIASAFSIKKTSRHQGNPVRIINCMDIFPGEHEVYEDNIRILENIRYPLLQSEPFSITDILKKRRLYGCDCAHARLFFRAIYGRQFRSRSIFWR